MEIDFKIINDNFVKPQIIPESSEDTNRLRDAIQSLCIANPCKRFASEFRKAENGEPSMFSGLTSSETIKIATAANNIGEYFKDTDGEMAQEINAIKLFEMLLSTVINELILKNTQEGETAS